MTETVDKSSITPPEHFPLVLLPSTTVISYIHPAFIAEDYWQIATASLLAEIDFLLWNRRTRLKSIDNHRSMDVVILHDFIAPFSDINV
jgi:hypothetical protein